MAIYNAPRYKILIDPESKKMQGLRVGDIARRQYSDQSNTIYSLMAVVETGVDLIGENESHYFIGALIEGDEPRTGEILDFVRVTNLFEANRSGALYLTASDSESPFMDVIDGVAFEKSLSFPCMTGGSPDVPDKNKYSFTGVNYATIAYAPIAGDVSRVARITRKGRNVTGGNDRMTLKQPIEGRLGHPQRVLISYKIRASQSGSNIPVTFGYTDDSEIDGSTIINITTDWSYHLHVVNIDFPEQYPRCFSINFSSMMLRINSWCDVAELNIIRQSDISSFGQATKTRIGKISGVVDPIFGVLDGYGAYFQNLYASRNVNIAGTLTAGDSNGFASTFYVGKIHKNVILNSCDCEFTDGTTQRVPEKNPVGIGHSWQLGDVTSFAVQTTDWRTEHTGQQYCLSFWAKSPNEVTHSIYQDEYYIGDLSIDSPDWKRYSVVFKVKGSVAEKMFIRFISSESGVYFTAPQLEAGKTVSQYQPTDGTLSYVEDYGAWFNKGGVGGTIQNPLLRLNEDGSISSRDNSFVINPDGTGHFANGRFKWEKDKIILQDVTIKWEIFDEETQNSLKAKTVTLSGTDTFHYSNEFDVTTCEPKEAYVFAQENNFSSTSRKWQYLAADQIWKDIPGNPNEHLLILPNSHYWEERRVLSIRYIAYYQDNEVSDIFTLSKTYDGESAYLIQIQSSKGTIFRNGVISTTLRAFVYKGTTDITELIPDDCFNWKRISENPESDALWNSADRSGKTLELSGEDVYYKAVFDCEVKIAVT